jgi:hypothetical protein
LIAMLGVRKRGHFSRRDWLVYGIALALAFVVAAAVGFLWR